MSRTGLEIVPGIGLGGYLLGQSGSSMPLEESWEEVPGIRRAELHGGAIQAVIESATDRVIGLIAQHGYTGQLPEGVRLGMPLAEARRLAPSLQFNDFDGSWYEPDRLAFVLYPPLEGPPEVVDTIAVCEWQHDYWAHRRPLLELDEP